MKLFKIAALTLLAFSTSFATEDLTSPLPQTSRQSVHPETLEDLKPVLMQIISSLEEENVELKRQLRQLSVSFVKTQHQISPLIIQDDSLETGVEFVKRIFSNLKRFTLEIVSNLEQENADLKKLLGQKTESDARFADSSYPFDVQCLMLSFLEDQTLSTMSTVCHGWTLVTETLFLNKSPIKSPLRLDMWPKEFLDALQTNKTTEESKKLSAKHQPNKHSYFLRQGLWDTVTYLETVSETKVPNHVTTWGKIEKFAQYCDQFSFCTQDLARFAYHHQEQYKSRFKSTLRSFADHYFQPLSSTPKPPSPLTVAEVYLASRPNKRIATVFGQETPQMETYNRGYAAGLCGHFNFLITEGCPDIVDYYARRLGVPTQINLAAYYINNVHEIDAGLAQNEAKRYKDILNPISCLHFNDLDNLNIGLGQFSRYNLIGVNQLMPNLTELHFTSGKTEEDSTSHLVTLPTITKLGLYNNETVTNPMVRQMTQLTALNLDGNTQITGNTVQSLTGLQELSIKRNHAITDEILRTMPNLHTITR